MLYLISYHLMRPGHDTKQLIATLEAMRATQVLDSEWIVATDARPIDIRARIIEKGKLDPTDCLLVSGLTGDNAWQHLLIDDATAAQVLRAKKDDSARREERSLIFPLRRVR